MDETLRHKNAGLAARCVDSSIHRGVRRYADGALAALALPSFASGM
jgi:hypothetical protein